MSFINGKSDGISFKDQATAFVDSVGLRGLSRVMMIAATVCLPIAGFYGKRMVETIDRVTTMQAEVASKLLLVDQRMTFDEKDIAAIRDDIRHALSDAYRTSDATRDFAAINARVDGTTRRIEELERRK
jgi:hypothetical protein